MRAQRPVTPRQVDLLAVVVGGLRLASGVSFLVAPEAANRLWGDAEDSGPTASLLLRSMGSRDALVGGLLLYAGATGGATAGWFLASAGADAADLVGGIANHDRMTEQQRRRGLGGAAAGIVIGLVGALRPRARVSSR
ncbi:MAG: DUF4267 domain-containing protein [Acidimicrobiia bacterium]